MAISPFPFAVSVDVLASIEKRSSLAALHSVKRRLLVVDDDPLVLRALAHQLNKLGHQADLTSDSLRALTLADGHEYEVAIVDLLMPGLDGTEVMHALVERSALTSFVVMTGATLEQRDFRGLDSRIAGVLKKPIELGELAQAVSYALDLARKRRSQSTAPESSIRLLLVEDSPHDASLLKAALDAVGGYDVTHVTRLADAVKALHGEAFDSVITDLSLPDARGLGAVLRLRECAPEAALLACSATADDALALQVIELGAQDFIAKAECQPETLARALRFARMRRDAERRLARLAHSDALTGLHNRAAFDERFEQALAQAKRQATRLGVMYLDLDGFKAVNDQYGHGAGDALLREVAHRIRGAVREYDCVARLGGDEFAILVTGLSQGGLETAAARVAQAIAVPLTLSDGPSAIEASIGLASFPDDAEDAAQLVRTADDQMYRFKRARRGPSGPPSQELPSRLEPTSELRRTS